MNEAANKGGMIAFALSMVITVVYFLGILAGQPGPADRVKYNPQGQTAEQYVNYRQGLLASTPEQVEKGKKLFQVHFGFAIPKTDFDQIVQNLNDGKVNTGELGIFNFLTNGLGADIRGKFNYIPEDDRWAMTHYLRSLVKSPQSSTSQEKSEYLHYGL